MADNVQITAGSGTVIATDEVSRNATTEHQQIVKLSLGAEGAHDNLVDSGEQNASDSVPVVPSSDAATFESLTTFDTSNLTDANYDNILTPGGNLRYIEVYNDSDDSMILSFDAGTTDHWRVPVGEGRIFDFAICQRYVSTTISIKRAGGSTPSGNFYLSAYR